MPAPGEGDPSATRDAPVLSALAASLLPPPSSCTAPPSLLACPLPAVPCTRERRFRCDVRREPSDADDQPPDARCDGTGCCIVRAPPSCTDSRALLRLLVHPCEPSAREDPSTSRGGSTRRLPSTPRLSPVTPSAAAAAATERSASSCCAPDSLLASFPALFISSLQALLSLSLLLPSSLSSLSPSLLRSRSSSFTSPPSNSATSTLSCNSSSTIASSPMFVDAANTAFRSPSGRRIRTFPFVVVGMTHALSPSTCLTSTRSPIFRAELSEALLPSSTRAVQPSSSFTTATSTFLVDTSWDSRPRLRSPITESRTSFPLNPSACRFIEATRPNSCVSMPAFDVCAVFFFTATKLALLAGSRGMLSISTAANMESDSKKEGRASAL
mmetsp:Transcript_33424/g.93815  ORF Transcript_33424/g.93815 Transcript_33424/m.93815 type:complete len:385 (+) Transcript_33424:418-1572(+)